MSALRNALKSKPDLILPASTCRGDDAGRHFTVEEKGYLSGSHRTVGSERGRRILEEGSITSKVDTEFFSIEARVAAKSDL
jgi:hypothetical protein